MTTVLRDNVFTNRSWEDVSCPNCGRKITLYFNGGQGDKAICCGVEFEARAKGYEIVSTARKTA